ncbi:AraC family transcriptional regulator [Rhizobium ruizarguesonis]
MKNATVAVTEIRCDKEHTGLTEPIPVEDAFLVTVQLRDVRAHRLFIDGRQVRTEFLPAGTANIYDLRSSPVADSISTFHHLSFYLPRAALLEVAEREGLPDVDGFDQHPGMGVKDEILHNLARAILPCFRSPLVSNRLLVDHVSIAAAAHAIKTYAGCGKPTARKVHRLSQDEDARAKESMAEHLDGDVSLGDLSSEVGMSPLDFAASFELSAGTSIHQWRANLRAERIQRLIERGYDLHAIARMLEMIDDEMRDTEV